MEIFIEKDPQWDHDRLMQADIAGFVFQHGLKDLLLVRRHHFGGLFCWEESCTL
ncbi:MAG: DUF2811 domain-containing protein [Synechococcus sp. MIT S9220]|nr:DUF2811 domain-containing protein [Synechococcus sp. MIT S9220]